MDLRDLRSVSVFTHREITVHKKLSTCPSTIIGVSFSRTNFKAEFQMNLFQYDCVGCSGRCLQLVAEYPGQLVGRRRVSQGTRRAHCS
jgi:hypothetical protein